jgi:hypothetical protein
MKLHPEKYQQKKQLELSKQVKMNWNYNKIMMVNGQVPIPTLTKEMIEKLTKK